MIISEDTDVFVIFLGVHAEIGSRSKIRFRRGKGNKIRFIDTNRHASVLGKDVRSAILGLYAWTSCDTVSFFAGRKSQKC